MLTHVAVCVRRWIGREKYPYAHATQMPPIAAGIPRLKEGVLRMWVLENVTTAAHAPFAVHTNEYGAPRVGLKNIKDRSFWITIAFGLDVDGGRHGLCC